MSDFHNLHHKQDYLKSNFEVVNHIKIEICGDNQLLNKLMNYQDAIKKGTLCDIIEQGETGSNSLEFEFDGKKVNVFISKI